MLLNHMNNLSAVFWDVDGTIADTELSGHRVAFNLAFKDFELDWYWNENKYLELLKISGGLKRIIHYRDLIQSELNNDDCSRIQSRKRFHYRELINSGKIKVRHGVLRLVRELADFNIVQIIVTTSGRDSLDPLLNNSLKSYLKFFSHIITYEDVHNHKPFPDAYDLAVKLSKQSKENCIAIEDSRVGVEAAIRAGINCLLTLPPWSSNSHNLINDANACVDSLGHNNSYSKLIYGKPLINNMVDVSYLKSILI